MIEDKRKIVTQVLGSYYQKGDEHLYHCIKNDRKTIEQLLGMNIQATTSLDEVPAVFCSGQLA